VDEAAFQRIKTQIRAAQIYGKDNVDGLARKYGEALAIGLTVEDIQSWPDVLQAVTPEDVMAAAAQVLDRRRAVTGHLVKAEENAL
jgi:zinc protease